MKNLLLVEDSVDLCQQVIESLAKEGRFKTDVANTANEAREKLTSNVYDVLILDYHLPDSKGLDIIRQLKDEGKSVQCPIIMLTTESEEQGSEVKDLNVICWCLKPVSMPRLVDLIDQVVQFANESK